VANILCCVLVRACVRGGIGMSAVHRCGSPQLSAASHLRHLGRRLSEHAAQWRQPVLRRQRRVWRRSVGLYCCCHLTVSSRNWKRV